MIGGRDDEGPHGFSLSCFETLAISLIGRTSASCRVSLLAWQYGNKMERSCPYCWLQIWDSPLLGISGSEREQCLDARHGIEIDRAWVQIATLSLFHLRQKILEGHH